MFCYRLTVNNINVMYYHNDILVSLLIFFCRTVFAVDWCPSICLSVRLPRWCRPIVLKTAKFTIKVFSSPAVVPPSF